MSKFSQMIDKIEEDLPKRFVIDLLEILPFAIRGSIAAWEALEALGKEVKGFRSMPEDERQAILSRESELTGKSFSEWRKELEALKAKPDA